MRVSWVFDRFTALSMICGSHAFSPPKPNIIWIPNVNRINCNWLILNKSMTDSPERRPFYGWIPVWAWFACLLPKWCPPEPPRTWRLYCRPQDGRCICLLGLSCAQMNDRFIVPADAWSGLFHWSEVCGQSTSAQGAGSLLGTGAFYARTALRHYARIALSAILNELTASYLYLHDYQGFMCFHSHRYCLSPTAIWLQINWLAIYWSSARWPDPPPLPSRLRKLRRQWRCGVDPPTTDRK